jgi:hypothetical protein
MLFMFRSPRVHLPLGIYEDMKRREVSRAGLVSEEHNEAEEQRGSSLPQERKNEEQQNAVGRQGVSGSGTLFFPPVQRRLRRTQIRC